LETLVVAHLPPVNEKARAENERRYAEEARAQAAAREASKVVAPRIDPGRPRFEQFFQYVCPFCGHGEEIGLWYPSKTCARCARVGRIVREP
jgi:hypothetical protein